METRRPEAAIGVACFKGEAVLLIRRARAPLAGQWTLPGGRIGWGERAEDAAIREIAEETGVAIEIVGVTEVFDLILPDAHFLIVEFAALWRAGAPAAGDDAAEAAFFPPDALEPLGLSEDVRRVIATARALAGVAR